MKQITIYELLPLLRKGWVAMDADGDWVFYGKKPKLSLKYKGFVSLQSDSDVFFLDMFNIAPFDGDWKDSCKECGKCK